MPNRAAALLAALAAMALTLAGCGPRADDPSPAGGLDLTIDYRTLDNGLRVAMAPIDGAPTVTVGVYYRVGFRSEERGRTGFAHLFEHLMFTGSRHLPSGELDRLVESVGGTTPNGTTNFDYTNYFQTVPSHALESVLWAEADRMAFPDITEQTLAQQQGVVVNEVLVNVLNQPYGGFPWLDVPQVAFENWYNAHNFYGELTDIQRATLDDAADFFDRFYRPSNAVLVIAGDFDPDQAFEWAAQYFGPIPDGGDIAFPDVSEPRQEREKTATRHDRLIPEPALAFAYQLPERGTDAYFALGLIDQILAQGQDSRLYRTLIQERGYASDLYADLGLFSHEGPMLWTVYLIHDSGADAAAILADADAVIAPLQEEQVSTAELDRARTKLLSRLYDMADSPTRVGLIDLLASFALFDDDPALINTLESRFRAVTPDLILETAIEYLRPTNRTVLRLIPDGPPDDPFDDDGDDPDAEEDAQ